MEYDSMHPKLFYQTGAAPGWFKADCPCHLLAQVPEQARLDAWNFMNGVRAATEEVRAVALRWVDVGEDSGLEEILAKLTTELRIVVRDAFPRTEEALVPESPGQTPDRSDTHQGEEAK
jgi:hypothetical protein